jgi:hypothetical protein
MTWTRTPGLFPWEPLTPAEGGAGEIPQVGEAQRVQPRYDRVMKYIDPATGSHWIVQGNATRISAKLGRVAMLLMMKRGSVPGCRFFTCGLRDITRRDRHYLQRIVATVDKALRPHQTTSTHDGLYESYERTATMENGVPVLRVTIKNGDGLASTTIPLPPPASEG